MKERRNDRFGVIGAGRIGKVHAKTIAANPKAKLAYVADAIPKAAADLAELRRESGLGCGDHEAERCRRGLIGSPTAFHAEQIQAASHAGKSIMCEKPVSLSVAAIHETLQVVEKNKSTLMIGFNRRFDPNFAEVEARLREGAIGDVELATVISARPCAAAGRLCEGLGRPVPRHDDHDFDMARFLMSEDSSRAGAGRGAGRSWRSAGGRRRYRRRTDADRLGSHRGHHQFAPCYLRL